MGLESIYKLSVIINMIDNISNPMSRVSSDTLGKLDKLNQGFSGLTKTGAAITGAGVGIVSGVLGIVESTFETQDALAKLSSLGVKDLEAVEDAAKGFSDTWAGTTKSDFINAAYDIKSGIASLSDEGIAKYTELSGLTAKATKATIGEMTSLFATGYGIYKDYYSDLSDIEFGEMFSAGIADAVRAYKTSGSGMAQSIQSLGGAATVANVPFEEQLSVLGMLQATMSGSEAGTKYKAFLASAAKAGKTLKISFLDANNQLLSMPEILATLKGKYGDTLDAIEKQEIAKAFGTQEAVALIDLLYGKTGELESNIVSMYGTLGTGAGTATKMADAINSTTPEQYKVLKQQIDNVKESIGVGLLPVVNEYLAKGRDMLQGASDWISKNQDTVSSIMKIALTVGIILTVLGVLITTIGGIGIILVKVIGGIKGFIGIIKGIPSLITTIRICAMYAGDGLKIGFSKIKGVASMFISNIKNMTMGMIGMAKQAITTAVTAMPGLISSVWAFTSALLANPITWIIVGIVALIAVLILLWNNWGQVTDFIKGAWITVTTTITDGLSWIGEKLSGLPEFIKNAFVNGIDNIKEFIGGVFGWFGEAGSKVLTTFTDGITSVVNKPVEVVKGALAKVRELLPFSDAHEGPLSQLTLSGKRVFETINTGMEATQDLPYKTTHKSFIKANKGLDLLNNIKVIGANIIKVDFSKIKNNDNGFNNTKSDNELKIKKISLKEIFKSQIKDEKSERIEKENRKIVINNLNLEVDINKIKDLALLQEFLDGVKDTLNNTADYEEESA